mmetsp:Transcript_27829/g.77976  ORF Transcript_27829/g.77976 Transcript_27829/m.77976 type:complete len:879 (+) Transcript_27829:229-2865(+)
MVKRRTEDPDGAELDGLVREMAIKSARSDGLSGGWKAVIILLVAIIILLITDSIEIKMSKDDSNGKSLQGGITKVKEAAAATTAAATTAATTTAATQPATDPAPQDGGATTSAATTTTTSTIAGATASASASTSSTTTTTTTAATTTTTAAAAPAGNVQLCKADDCWTYSSRAQPITDEEKKKLAAEHGSWTWTDEPVRDRKMLDLYKKYANRDVPWKDMPGDIAWQKNNAYMTRYLKESKDLVMRAMEAILAEYGHGKKDAPNDDFATRSQMFSLLTVPDEELLELKQKNAPGLENGGFTTPRSWEGLKRRLLHALITEDSFVFAMGGHSAAAGHGNHFSQSYTLQVAWILEPIFARLGVRHEARNMANGGMGTGQHGIAAATMYGPDVDMLMWDSGMTEPGGRDPDLMARQSIISGIKVPVLWSFPYSVLQNLNRFGECEVGSMGQAMTGIAEATTTAEVDKTIWAARFMKCASDIDKEFCKTNRFNATCWIERDDFTPEKPQSPHMGGQASWHPGNRVHQLQGRTLAFTILQALHEALNEWSEAPNFELPDDKWHVTTHYENIREKVLAIEPENSPCYGLSAIGLERVCKLPMKARSEWSPRPYPDLTSMRSIMPKEQVDLIDPPPPVSYQSDVFNPVLHPPPGEVDVLNIVANGPEFREVLKPHYESYYYNKVAGLDKPKQKPGKGHILTHPSGICDGTLDSFCKRDAKNDCLLNAHNDARSGIFTDSVSGWLLWNIPKVENGYILLKAETWHFRDENPKTIEWKSINNENDNRQLRGDAESGRMLGKRKQEPYCDEFRYEISINGKVKTLDKNQFTGDTSVGELGSNDGIRKQMQRVVEIITLADDPNLKGDVEVGVRIKGCKEFLYSHIYWS